MSIEAPIKSTSQWHRWEHKELLIEIKDDQVVPEDVDSLEGLELRFLLKSRPRSATVLLEKTTGSGVSLDEHDDAVAIIDIEVEDYENLPPDLYYYELWDDSNNLQLAYGRALLQQGTEPV
jgi:hypothetical protein